MTNNELTLVKKYPQQSQLWGMSISQLLENHSDIYTDFQIKEESDGSIAIYGKKKIVENPYRSAIIDRLDGQINKGLNKYGLKLQDNVQLDMTERLEHLAEELTDGLQYIEHLKANKSQILQALTEVISELLMMAGSTNNQQLMKITKSLNLIAKQLA